jgi:hypothetical protein
MANTDRLSDESVASVAQAIFAKGGPTVAEAYSEFGCEPRRFACARELCAYALERRQVPSGSVHLAIHYPEASGRMLLKRISLDPSACNGFTHRFTHEGWGLIWVHLHLAGSGSVGSFISANSQTRAEKWATTYPELDPPMTWFWPAVASHARRLTRVLKQSSS